MKNGQYILICNEKVVQYLGYNPDEALKYLESYMKNNKRAEPALVQVHAVAEFQPPIIKTLAHEVLK